jgi:hypothetical protein
MAKVKIPKKIAGVKIPKKARKKANKALKATASPLVQGLAGAAIAGATRAARVRAESGFSTHVAIDGEALAEALREAARDGLKAFLEGLEEGLRADPPRDADAVTAH